VAKSAASYKTSPSRSSYVANEEKVKKGNMKKIKDWDQAGSMLAGVMDIWNFCRDLLKKLNVTPDILGWLKTKKGQAALEEGVQVVVNAFQASRPTLPKPDPKVLKTTLDIGKQPRLPFAGATVEKHTGTGTVTIEKRADGQLYIDGKKVVLHLSERQLGGKWLKGHELRTELDNKPVLNATILDFLQDHPEYIPDDLKQDEQGKTRYIFFWGTIYRNAGGNLYVRYLCWLGGQWQFLYGWLDGGWLGGGPAACLAS